MRIFWKRSCKIAAEHRRLLLWTPHWPPVVGSSAPRPPC